MDKQAAEHRMPKKKGEKMTYAVRVLTGGGCISGCLSPKRVNTMVTTTQQTGPHYSWLCCRDGSSKQRTMLGTRVKQQREGATIAKAAHVMLWSSRSDYLRILSAMTIITEKIVEPFLHNLEKIRQHTHQQ